MQSKPFFFSTLIPALALRGIRILSIRTIVVLTISLFLTGDLFPSPGEEATNLLAPVRTDSPRDTMVTFITSMNRYREEEVHGSPDAQRFLEDAIRTMDLSDVSQVLQENAGRQSAIFLKEVIDRVIVIDPERIPGTLHDSGVEPPERWRLKGTEILIRRVDSGDRKGEYLFTTDTVLRARDFYNRVRSLPYLEGSGQGALYRAQWVDENLPAWARDMFLGFYWWQWLGLFALILAGLVFRALIRSTLDFLNFLARKTRYTLDQNLTRLAKGPLDLLAMGVFWFATLRLLRFEGDLYTFLSLAIRGVISIALIWAAYRLSSLLTIYFQKMAEKTESTLDDHLVPLLNRTIRIFTIILGTLVAVQNLGVNVMSLLAGLGIGGIAFALAAKDTVANFFGSIMILFDSPFQVGDWVVLGSAEGTVEEIGFRSTRIRTFYNSLITVPNSDLMNARIDNMGRRKYRRIRTTLGIRYDTDPERIEAFLEGLKKIIQANPHTRKDYFHVVLSGFGSSSLEIMVYCFLEVPDWSVELVERQNLFLEFLRLAKELKVEFAFPTETLIVEDFPGKGSLRPDIPSETPQALREKAHRFGQGGDGAMPGGQGIFTPPFRE